MELKRKFRILTWTFVIFAAFTVSTFIFMFSKPPTTPNVIFSPQPMHQPNNPGQFANYLMDNLKFSEVQKNQLIELQKEFRQNAGNIFDSIHCYNEEIDKLFEKNDFDTVKFNVYASKLSQCNYALKKNFFFYYKNIYNILDKNQQKKFFVVYKQFRQCCKVPHNPKNNQLQNKQPHNFKN